MHTRIRQRAFTLAELLITAALISLLATLATPAIARLLEHNRNQAVMHSIHAQLQQARSQAVLKKQDVELCPSKNGRKCTQDWQGPWLIRLRRNQQALHHATALAGVTNLRWSGFSSSIRFHSNGTSPISNGRFYTCEQQAVTMQIVLNRQGRIRWASPQENQRESARCE
ncbi:MAG: hypothetical protein A3J24_00550 [Deltaproteobacteria bacterium RIFCSPLOWO2_02_FULL_53_8]|nr:MAG: hypothetical protein A3J24_00550 [Deltaproteobacteria bacterium RIFCSPLOWO2_02_FULL_53_8]